MTFKIIFIDDKVPAEWLQPGEDAAFARITIDDFNERMLVPLGYWSQADYKAQWTAAITELEQKGRSALIVEMYNPRYANFIKCWPLYRNDEENVVYVFNQTLFLDELSDPFRADDIAGYIDEKPEFFSNDGSKISSWKTSVLALRNWRNELAA